MLMHLSEIEDRLWRMADNLRANTHLRSSEYSLPVLGLIFLKFAHEKFVKVDKEIRSTLSATSRYEPSADSYRARGAIYLRPQARFDYLLKLTDSDDRSTALNKAMEYIGQDNSDLEGSLPTNAYSRLDNTTLGDLLRRFGEVVIDPDMEGDPFGRIYEYFLSKFALSEGQRGGEFFTPTSVVQLIVEVIEPFNGLILDPACGSGGMFVQSAQFVKNHLSDPSAAVAIHGQEKAQETVRLCKMNLAVHGLYGDIKGANSYYDDLHNSTGRFDFVMANPPFNVNGVEKERIKSNTQRFPFGMPRVDNGNYLWIQIFYSALKETGRAGFVMPNSASDARNSEQEIRSRIIQDRVVDVMIAVGSNFFYTVTLPCTLWFFDKGKRTGERRDKVLFIDARHLYKQIDRAHREFTQEQIELLANIVRLYRGEEPENRKGSAALMQEHFPDGVYMDIPGLCKIASIDEIEQQGWSLNPGRYVGVAERAAVDFDFKEKLEELNEELTQLNEEAHELEERISENMARLLEEMGD